MHRTNGSGELKIKERKSMFSDTRFSRASDIAAVGMSLRTPGTESIENFWASLLSGLDVHRKAHFLDSEAYSTNHGIMIKLICSCECLYRTDLTYITWFDRLILLYLMGVV